MQDPADLELELGSHSHTWYKTSMRVHRAFHILGSDPPSWMATVELLAAQIVEALVPVQ